MIGPGKPVMMYASPMRMVLKNAAVNFLSLNIIAKLLYHGFAHGLPRMPLLIL